MKRVAVLFILIVFVGLSIVPAINLLAIDRLPEKRWTRAYLFNMDKVAAQVNHVLFRLRISTDPGRVVIGRDGWLFLGDRFQNTITHHMTRATEEDQMLGRRLGKASDAWSTWLMAHGVRGIRIMIAPDKSTIYQSHMPEWARSPDRPSMAGLLEGLLENPARASRFIDLRPAVEAAARTSPEPVYYATDTHWNMIGAVAGFRAFAQSVALLDPSLRWPDDSALSMTHGPSRNGGDLSRFLYLQDAFFENDALTELQINPVDTVQNDFDEGKLISSSGNPLVHFVNRPVRVLSDRALNNVRVLWLRDSFGTAMSPLMAATFSDVVQVHWASALNSGGSMLMRLVEGFRPDYVFLTAVERNWREPELLIVPAAIFSH